MGHGLSAPTSWRFAFSKLPLDNSIFGGYFCASLLNIEDEEEGSSVGD